jgi:magnesium transporter
MTSMKQRRRGKRNGFHRRTGPGASPGTLVADPGAKRPSMQAIAYGPDEVVEHDLTDPSDARHIVGRLPVTWINVDSLGDATIVATLGQIFGLHRLAQEDVLNAHQRPKVEKYDDNYFIVLRMADMGEGLGTEQLSLFLGPDYVLTFQERPGDCFGPVRDRIRKKSGRIRSVGPDYLAYALVDAVIDNFFPILEDFGEKLEILEDDVVLNPDEGFTVRIHQAKRDLLTLRRAVWPLREAISSLVREESHLISPDTRVYLRDCYDHSIQIIDILENYRDVAGSLMEVFLSSISNRMNEIMKILTIFTTIFIPLTFIAGIYGMNFNPERSPLNMPELNWYWGYPFALGSMGAVALGMLVYFQRKGWILRRRKHRPDGRD